MLDIGVRFVSFLPLSSFLILIESLTDLIMCAGGAVQIVAYVVHAEKPREFQALVCEFLK